MEGREGGNTGGRKHRRKGKEVKEVREGGRNSCRCVCFQHIFLSSIL